MYISRKKKYSLFKVINIPSELFHLYLLQYVLGHTQDFSTGLGLHIFSVVLRGLEVVEMCVQKIRYKSLV